MPILCEACVCGNVLRRDTGIRINVSPCRCARPGPGRSTSDRGPSLDHVSRRQFEERRRTGLPLLTPLERSVLRREV